LGLYPVFFLASLRNHHRLPAWPGVERSSYLRSGAGSGIIIIGGLVEVLETGVLLRLAWEARRTKANK